MWVAGRGDGRERPHRGRCEPARRGRSNGAHEPGGLCAGVAARYVHTRRPRFLLGPARTRQSAVLGGTTTAARSTTGNSLGTVSLGLRPASRRDPRGGPAALLWLVEGDHRCYDPDVPDTSGSPLKVLAAGLHQLGGECEKISGELAAAGGTLVVATSPWQSNAQTVNIAAAAAGKDLGAIAGRVGARGVHYSTAGTAYTATDEEGAGRIRGLAG